MSARPNNLPINRIIPLVGYDQSVKSSSSKSEKTSEGVTLTSANARFARAMIAEVMSELKEVLLEINRASSEVQSIQQQAAIKSAADGASSGFFGALMKTAPTFGSATVAAGACMKYAHGMADMHNFTTDIDPNSPRQGLANAEAALAGRQEAVRALNSDGARGEIMGADGVDLGELPPEQGLALAKAELKQAELVHKRAEREYQEGKDEKNQKLRGIEQWANVYSGLMNTVGTIAPVPAETAEKLAQTRTQVLNADARQTAETRAEINKAYADALSTGSRLGDVHMGG